MRCVWSWGWIGFYKGGQSCGQCLINVEHDTVCFAVRFDPHIGDVVNNFHDDHLNV